MKTQLKLLLTLISCFLFISGAVYADKKKDRSEKRYNIHVSELKCRDPFIFLDKNSGTYILHVNGGDRVVYYESPDLENWRYGGNSFVPGRDFWGTQDFWAPDLYEYRGKYYIFITLSAPGVKRGTSILVADDPRGPFEPLVNRPATPEGHQCLDGALHIDKQGNPWLLYCREWLEVTDGQICAIRLTDDLTGTIGEPEILFRASSAKWVEDIKSNNISPQVKGKVTDAPFIHTLEDGRMIMLWSSFSRGGKYAIGQALSEGELSGPWTQSEKQMNNDMGGHAMTFYDKEGRLMISYHAPNKAPSFPVIREVFVVDGRFVPEDH